MSTSDFNLGRRHASRDFGEATSRCFDLLIAVTALIVLAPVFLAAMAAVWIEGGRPLFFAQRRLGRGGRPFVMYKFRKFGAASGTDGCPLTVAGDRRLTRIGALLAATKLDELPQLWNVLRGDMAIVGPRPESMAFADCFRGGFETVLDFKPGLLGPSQIHFRNECRFYPADADPTRFYREVLFPAKARLDLAYFPTRTRTSDVAMLVRGVLAVLGWAPGGRASHDQTAAADTGLPDLLGAATRKTGAP
ncbi:UDP-N-acetylgalactosamine-undecaprenyl-phosphate N-acetylgalactosaminephosphotransferase [bacterium YEK0313]|nr:UDP-N-acetylgalactosamine-undecaprenyl-phosphate N-acetylgalactosaminephosphotransferase [bacterium YEK0313]